MAFWLLSMIECLIWQIITRLFLYLFHGENFKAEVEVVFRCSATSLLSDKKFSSLPLFIYFSTIQILAYYPFYTRGQYQLSNQASPATYRATHSLAAAHTSSFIPPWKSIIRLLKTPNSAQSRTHPLRGRQIFPERSAGKGRLGILSIRRIVQCTLREEAPRCFPS